MHNSTHFHLGTWWRYVVSCTPRPLYPRGKTLLCLLDTRLGWPHGRISIPRENKNLHLLAGIEDRLPARPSRSQFCHPYSAPRLLGRSKPARNILRQWERSVDGFSWLQLWSVLNTLLKYPFNKNWTILTDCNTIRGKRQKCGHFSVPFYRKQFYWQCFCR